MKLFLKLYFLFLTLLFADSQAQPYVILISFDGFRWDYVNRNITPNFDIIKETGVFANSLRPCFPSKTFPNHTSIITGLYPEHHGIISNIFKDYFTGKQFSMGDTIEARNGWWYKGEAFWETAEMQGIITASYFWPGSDVSVPYRHPTYFYKYEHSKPYKERVDGVIDWLQLSYEKRPHFITSYFDATDSYGHNFGPNSPEVNLAVAQLDSILGYLFQKLKEINLFDSTNIIVVSDHGMAETSIEKTVNIEEILDGYNYESGDNGPFMLIEPAKGVLENIYKKLNENEHHYKVYKKENVPEYFHYSDNPLISKLVIIAENGWGVETNKSLKNLEKYGTKGNHGYDNYWMDMNGIFYAMGPAFKVNYRVGTINNIDIYPLLCKIFNLVPSQLIDGKLERIVYILK
ncbi:MAG: ectonucleotide pyrophosphatase/phosphodiesterase [Ignavibacteria bacterium]|nr:ectonucleotide pyrophosphatase/phosphodiesterase [Ignavibacteria bacterium]